MLDIRLGRLVQIVNVLNVTDDIRKVELEWSAKLIAGAVANTIEDEKGRKILMDNIQAQNLRGVKEEGGDNTTTTRRADTSGDQRSFEEILEQGSVHQALARNLQRKGPGFLGMS